MEDHIISISFDANANQSGTIIAVRSITTTLKAAIPFYQIQIKSQGTGRTHSCELRILDEHSRALAYEYFHCSDNESVRVGRNQITATLSPGKSYEVQFEGVDFDEGELVAITVDFVAYQSNIGDITAAVIEKAEADTQVNALVFGIAEGSFSSFMGDADVASEPVGTTPLLKMDVFFADQVPVPAGIPPAPDVSIDVDAQAIVITAGIILHFVVPPLGSSVGGLAAVARAAISVVCKPVMTADTNDVLQLEFKEAAILDGTTNIEVYSTSDIITGFSTEELFFKFVRTTLTRIVERSSGMESALPAYLALATMPDHWNRFETVIASFVGFDYRRVTSHSIDIPYLFIVFSVRSLNLPAPCFCEQQTDVVPDLVGRAIQEPLPHLRRNPNIGQLLGEPKPWPVKPYADISAIAEVLAIGISQRTFREILSSRVNIGDEHSATARSGAVYEMVRVWFRATLQEAAILADGFSAGVDVHGEGAAKAAVKLWTGGDIVSASVRLRVNVESASCSWIFDIQNIRDEITGELVNVVIVRATASIGNITVEFDHLGDPPKPFDKTDDWVLTSGAQFLKSMINVRLALGMSVKVLETSGSSDNIALSYMEDYYQQFSCAVFALRMRMMDG